MARKLEDHQEAEQRRHLHRLLGLGGTSADPEQRAASRDFRSMLYAVPIGVGMFLITYWVLDLGAVSKQDRAALFQFTIAAPVILEVCAERGYGDPSDLRRAAQLAPGFLREARDRSAEGLIPVPRGSTVAAEVERRLPELTAAARQEFDDPARSLPLSRQVCTALQVDLLWEQGAWARLEAMFPRQLRELGLSRRHPR
jgi:hypothetical protein